MIHYLLSVMILILIRFNNPYNGGKQMKTIKYSRQREAIINFLQTRKDHPTAEVIYNNIREEYPNISMGTVYRNLNLLSETGQILRISLEDNRAHFDGFTHEHCHFFCRECKGVLDIEIGQKSMKDIKSIAQREFEGKIECQTSIFYGVCKTCLGKSNLQTSH